MRNFVALSCLVALVACSSGGGGGNGPKTYTVPAIPAFTAQKKLTNGDPDNPMVSCAKSEINRKLKVGFGMAATAKLDISVDGHNLNADVRASVLVSEVSKTGMSTKGDISLSGMKDGEFVNSTSSTQETWKCGQDKEGKFSCSSTGSGNGNPIKIESSYNRAEKSANSLAPGNCKLDMPDLETEVGTYKLPSGESVKAYKLISPKPIRLNCSNSSIEAAFAAIVSPDLPSLTDPTDCAGFVYVWGGGRITSPEGKEISGEFSMSISEIIGEMNRESNPVESNSDGLTPKAEYTPKSDAQITEPDVEGVHAAMATNASSVSQMLLNLVNSIEKLEK